MSTVDHYQSVALALDVHRETCELRRAHLVCVTCRYLERLDDVEDERASLPFRGSSYAGLCDDAEEQAHHVVDLTGGELCEEARRLARVVVKGGEA